MADVTMDVSTLEIAIIAMVVMGAVILIVYLMKHQIRRCRWCMRSTTPVEHLPQGEGEEVRRLIRDEGMPGDPEKYEVCPHCKRIYGWRWFSDDRPHRRDWELLDRSCACGCDLSRPALIVDTNKLKTALREIRPEVMEFMERTYGREGLHERLYSSVSDEHLLFVCRNCFRIYMWLPVKGFQVFQVVSGGMDKFDGPN
ncbi:MAG: hypothetical protein OXR72_20360 [Gemmatimonadota bacterium]|nr:hypothetical protein [Gemmatimonadota bacterium]